MTSTTTIEVGPGGTEFLLRTWPNENPSATLLLVHGLYEHSGRWDHVGTFFQERGYDVHTYDMRDHGQTGGPPIDFASADVLVDDLSWRLDAIRTPGRPLMVYAHSVGALVAALHATTDRPQPDASVWSAPALGSSTSKVVVGLIRGLGKVAPKTTVSDKPKGEMLSKDPSVGEAYFADPLVRFKGTARTGVTLLEAMDRVKEHRYDITTPVFAVHGTDDGLIPPQVSAPLAQVPSVQRKLYPGYRHEMHNEPEYETLLGEADDFLRSQLAG